MAFPVERREGVEMHMRRPGIVTFNALLNLVIGVVFTFIDLVVITDANPHPGASAWHFWEWDSDVVIPMGILIAFSVGAIFVFFGLWRLRPWGRTLFNTINLLIGLALLGFAITGGFGNWEIESMKARIIVGCVSLIFLTAPLGMAKPEVKEAFKQ
jgi:hypothetical protein